MIDADADLYAALDDDMGVAATYTPPEGGDPVPCTVRWTAPDRAWQGYGTGATVVSRVLRVRAAVLPLVEEGGVFVVTGAGTHTVAKATLADRRRLLWTVELT